MANRVFPEAPASGRDTASSVLKGHVYEVNTKRYTASVVTEGAGRKFPDLPVLTFYAHSEKGEGAYVLPDIGASCWIATDGSDSANSAVILGFTPLSLPVPAKGDRDTQPQEGDEVAADYGLKRPQRLPGEFGWTSRDGAFCHYRKGGIVEIGSSRSCQRVYLPLGNHIRDMCEDYGQLTAGGVHYFNTDRREGDDGSDANSVWRVMVRNKSADAKATVLLEAGHAQGDKRLHIAIGAKAVDFKDGTYTVSDALYRLTIDESGNIDEQAAQVHRRQGTTTIEIAGDMDESVTGSSTETVTATKKITALDIQLFASSILLAGDVTMSSGPTGGGGLTLNPGLRITCDGIFDLPGSTGFDLRAFLSAFNYHVHVMTGTPGPVLTGGPISPYWP